MPSRQSQRLPAIRIPLRLRIQNIKHPVRRRPTRLQDLIQLMQRPDRLIQKRHQKQKPAREIP